MKGLERVLPVEILPVQETIVLRARGSELLILPHHVKKLKDLTKSRDFSQYFRDEALVNRPARKLFEAWLRKDHSLWQRLYTTVHKTMNNAEAETSASDQAAAPAAESAAPVSAKADEVDAKPAPKKEKAAKPAPAKKEKEEDEPKKKTAAKKEDEPKKKAAPAKKAKEEAEPKKAAAAKKDDKKSTTTKAASGAAKAKKKG
jgi:hypothetical protein